VPPSERDANVSGTSLSFVTFLSAMRKKSRFTTNFIKQKFEQLKLQNAAKSFQLMFAKFFRF